MKKIGLIFLSLVLAVGFLIPEDGHRIPVAGANAADWNPRSFWYHPFSVRSLLPLFWQYDSRQPQAWNKIFYIDPGLLLMTSAKHE